MSDLPFIPVSEPSLGQLEREAVIRCIDSGWISSEGPEVERFEEEIARYAGRRYGIAVSSGTAALDVAVASLDIGPGDEVIVPTFTIISCITQVLRSGATPVFVDVDKDTWNIDVTQVEDRITPRTRALIVPHTYGLPADISPLLDLAKRYGFDIIEDAAEAHGLQYEGHPCGSFGTMSTFSFYPNKLITTGEGGMIVTDDEALAERCRRLRNLAFEPGRRFVHRELGWNYRMTNLQAALGLAQLGQAETFLRQKMETGRTYLELLSGLETVQLPLESAYGSKNVFWVFGLVVDESTGLNAAALMQRLHEYRIGTRPFFYPLHLQPVLAQRNKSQQGSFPVAELIAKQGLYLPMSTRITRVELNRVAKALRGSLRDGPSTDKGC